MTGFLQRALVAGMLLIAFFVVLWIESALLWAAVTALAAGVAVREWAFLSGYTSRECVVFAFLFAPVACVAWLILGNAPAARDAFFAGAVAFWAVVVPWWLVREWSPPLLFKGVAGISVIVSAWLAALVLFQQNPFALAAALGAVWVADTAAYVVGRGLGASLLAPRLSPRKTWEGFIAGSCAVFAYVLALSKWTDAWSLPLTLIMAAGFAVASLGLAGDLFESLAKRQAGVKDSGTILSGHGGALDRLDAALPVLPFAALVAPWL